MNKSEALKKKMKGVFHLTITHFDEHDEVDVEAIRKAVRFAADGFKGEDAVFVTTGSTAEFYALNDEECRKVIETIVDEVNGEFPVLAGTARGGTRWTIELSQAAQEAGADGVLVVNPYYQFATTEGLYKHFKQIAESIDIGLMIYNNPLQIMDTTRSNGAAVQGREHRWCKGEHYQCCQVLLDAAGGRSRGYGDHLRDRTYHVPVRGSFRLPGIFLGVR
jgi:hypothetical protein